LVAVLSTCLQVGRILVPLAPVSANVPDSETPLTPAGRVKWLAEPGAESLPAGSAAATAGQVVIASVPGAAFLFLVNEDGSLRKLRRMAADSSAAYGVAPAGAGAVVADRDGVVTLWEGSADKAPAPRWRHELGERVTSVAWSGTGALVATWKNRLVALDGNDGRRLWSAEIGGRADAPAVAAGKDVFIATKAKALFRIDGATGLVRWKKLLPGPVMHPPAVLEGAPRTIVVATWDGQLLAFDAAAGLARWSVQLGAKVASAPLVARDLVAVVTADGQVRCYGTSGTPRWTASRGAEGPATLLVQTPAQGVARLLVASKLLVAFDASTGDRVAEYPRGALEQLRKRFADAMLEGVKTYSESEKRAVIEREAFDIAGPPFGPARTFGAALVLGTEEGWVHVFDASTLRPTGRYHAGPAASISPLLGSGKVVAAAGEDLFALDADTGRVLWSRNIGSDAGRLAIGDAVAVVGSGRLSVLNHTSGVLEWNLRGRFRSVSAQAVPRAGGPEPASVAWLADDGEGNLRVFSTAGQPLGGPLSYAGELLPIAATSEGGWVAATREGVAFGVAWQDGRLQKTWEIALGERLSDVQAAAGKLLLRSEQGTLVCFDLASRQQSWRLPLVTDARYEVSPAAGAVMILAPRDLRVHDLGTGEQKATWPLSARAVGGAVRRTSVAWLDHSGKAYAAGLDGPALLSGDVGVPLSWAAPVRDGFLVMTAAGEIGLVEWVDSDKGAGTSPAYQAGGRR
jgi:outer membrane protein assembly factor BamB